MLRTNATSACITCKERHERCLRPSEGQICTNCKKYNRNCIPVPGRKRGPKPRRFRPRPANFQPFPSINPYRTTETFQNPYVNQSLPSYYSFVHDESMPYHERNNTLPPNTFSTSYSTDFFFRAPLNVNPYEITQTFQNAFINDQNSFPSYLNDSFEISLPYNNVINTPLNINPFEITDTFRNTSINQSPSLSSSSFSFIHDEEPNNEPNITLSSFIHDGQESNNEPDITLSSFIHDEQEPNNERNSTLPPFIHDEQEPNNEPNITLSSLIHDNQEPNNEPNITSPSNSFSTGCSNDSLFFETQHFHNDTINTTLDINPYTFIYQSPSLSSPLFIHDEPEPNNE
ncbi:3213_t:CDS:1 [Cetraspora pellucida]|uniref:3213_t:CDS:1 n=1 Tax=Cetraspora pellucida TaxID=1433469 RepID=A0A9N9G1I9_9GLOM|nr:3213_t:CDS:1 [Cetraspora pellucida]